MYSAKFLKTLKTINYQHYTLESISGNVENFFHSKGTRRALGHLGTWALRHLGTQALEGHSGTRGTLFTRLLPKVLTF